MSRFISLRMGVLTALGMGCAVAEIRANSPVPTGVAEMLSRNCLDCHDASEKKGDVNLDHTTVDWTDPAQQNLWARALESVERGVMPPPKKRQPTPEARQAALAYWEESLLKHVSLGASIPRRLNQREYLSTIRSLFHWPGFTLPPGFPGDGESHGFDTVSDGLPISPTHLEAYKNVAIEIADELFPPKKRGGDRQVWEAGPEDMVLSFSAATLQGDALRLVSKSGTAFRSCSWPSRIEVQESGVYRFTVDASKFLSELGRPFPGPMVLEVRARDITASDRSHVNTFRLLKAIEVQTESPERTEFEAEVYEGETVLFRWANAEMSHDVPDLGAVYRNWFEQDRRFLAAWQKAVFPSGTRRAELTRLRGRNGWDIVLKNWEDPGLDLSQATMESEPTKKILEIADSISGTTSIADALCHFYHERGPALEFHHLTLDGPLRRVESPRDRQRKQMQQKLVGLRKDGQSIESFADEVVARLLPRAFRRPVNAETIADYQRLLRQHLAEGRSWEETLHLLIRSLLVSPRFLYHGVENDSERESLLANRLSYFLTDGPPDERLAQLARAGRLSGSLREVALRLLPKNHQAPFVKSFVGQWLDTERLASIMPDPRFDFDEARVGTARKETEMFFTEMLVRNLPMTDFIDPDFTFSTPEFLRVVYGITPPPSEEGETEKGSPQAVRRIALERGTRFGGLLGQSAILMATANGVDTQPVIRGVWVLENILGTPPPPPPKNVPALTPDTRGSKSPRELLAAHTRDSACAVCHHRIDPVGLVLENYDPVGRWRTQWPRGGMPIDPRSVLPDGTVLEGPVDLKRWLVEHIDQFSQCVGEKLMTYATGRGLNFAEKREIRTIVQRNHNEGGGFRDLLLALIESKTFQTP
jgi:hypothetical protein